MNPADYPRCKTCKHFKPSRFEDESNGACYQIVETENYDNPGDKLFDDEWDYEIVGPAFGCLHHSDFDTPAPQ